MNLFAEFNLSNNKKTKTLGKELVTTFESFHEKEKEDDFYNEDDCTN